MARVKAAGWVIDSNYFEAVDKFIAENKMFEEQVKVGLEFLVMGYAYTVVGIAQKKSAGPWGGGQQHVGHFFVAGTKGPATYQARWTGGAWKIPVRRLTGAYWMGWRAKRIGPMTWEVTNDSREAYFIEFGINHEGTGLRDSAGQKVRVRRPILKLSIMEAIEFIQASNKDVGMVESAWAHTSSGGPHLIGGTLYGAGTIAHTLSTPTGDAGV